MFDVCRCGCCLWIVCGLVGCGWFEVCFDIDNFGLVLGLLLGGCWLVVVRRFGLWVGWFVLFWCVVWVLMFCLYGYLVGIDCVYAFGVTCYYLVLGWVVVVVGVGLCYVWILFWFDLGG